VRRGAARGGAVRRGAVRRGARHLLEQPAALDIAEGGGGAAQLNRHARRLATSVTATSASADLA
jgi:hypothetical protein